MRTFSKMPCTVSVTPLREIPPPLVELPPDMELAIFDLNNPYSVFSLLPPQDREVWNRVDRVLLSMEESELRKRIHPSPTLNKIRIAFWYEYDVALRTGKALSLRRVWSGLISKENWGNYLKAKPLAWILTPTSSIESSLEDIMEHSLSKLRKILDAPIYKADGSLDSAAANVLVKIHKEIQQRRDGVVKHPDMRRYSNPGTPVPYPPPLPPGQKHEDLGLEIEEMRRQVSEGERTNTGKA